MVDTVQMARVIKFPENRAPSKRIGMGMFHRDRVLDRGPGPERLMELRSQFNVYWENNFMDCQKKPEAVRIKAKLVEGCRCGFENYKLRRETERFIIRMFDCYMEDEINYAMGNNQEKLVNILDGLQAMFSERARTFEDKLGVFLAFIEEVENPPRVQIIELAEWRRKEPQGEGIRGEGLRVESRGERARD
ncbi:Uncharacterised protein [Candidatus Gugararchaeum adminiculabundum]|nr:Uncharacterised protein [Candidatus Gugararchaeum adminiculabundum]